MKHILIVEDEPAIATMIQEILKLSDYASTICHDGNEALSLICSHDYDLILLDVMLPGMDGFEIMDTIRDFGIPVIFLTAKQNIEDKVRGLKSGAEDYIVKPFEALELIARIELVLRRHQPQDRDIVYENITYKPDSHKILMDGAPVHMTPKEYELIGFFLRSPGVVLTKEKLLHAVWDYANDGETRTVDIHINKLRKKLHLQDKLVTIPRIGYRLLRPEANHGGRLAENET